LWFFAEVEFLWDEMKIGIDGRKVEVEVEVEVEVSQKVRTAPEL
jgi:hypothetical protein